MKNSPPWQSFATIALLGCVLTNAAFAQLGVSSLSYDTASAGLCFSPIRTEELINLHLHDLPFPTDAKEPLQLDLQCGLLPDGRVAFQAGLATIRKRALKDCRGVNLVLVIDRSGSMQGDRICKVKESLKLLIAKLSPRDRVSVVSFSDEASVDLDWDNERRPDVVQRAIENIAASGSTNLHAGLMLGYEQAQKKYDPERFNQVILLTDGRANRGVTDPQSIASDSREFNAQGLGLSGIGLGNNFNRKLLTELAKAGKGTVHFVDNPNAMRRIFVDEFDCLLNKAARNIKLRLTWKNGAKLRKLHGYAPQHKDHELTIRPDNMGLGATQVVVCEFDAKHRSKVRVELSYDDCLNGGRVHVSSSLKIAPNQLAPFSKNHSLSKNVAIARFADTLSETSSIDHEELASSEAASSILNSVAFVRNYFPSGKDADVDRIVKLADPRLAQLKQRQRECDADKLSDR
jgi:Mg-chelatase subunit ChlD